METRETTREAPPEGPRTYPTGWQWNDDGSHPLVTAEDWLDEQGRIWTELGKDDDRDDRDPDDGATMRRIAEEIRTLRRDASLWAQQSTRNAADATLLRAATRCDTEGAVTHTEHDSPDGLLRAWVHASGAVEVWPLDPSHGGGLTLDAAQAAWLGGLRALVDEADDGEPNAND